MPITAKEKGSFGGCQCRRELLCSASCPLHPRQHTFPQPCMFCKSRGWHGHKAHMGLDMCRKALHRATAKGPASLSPVVQAARDLVEQLSLVRMCASLSLLPHPSPDWAQASVMHAPAPSLQSKQ